MLIGGLGKKRTPVLAARYADEFNLPFVSVDTTREQFARVRAACEEIGREPDELRENGVAGTPEEVKTIRRYADEGAERVYLQVLDLGDLDHLRLVAAEVMPHV